MIPLRVLFVEDSNDDVALLVRELRRGGYAPEFAQVQTADELRAALGRDWQVIVSDYSMPAFSGLDALGVLMRSAKDVPFILISGTVGEEIAVQAMKAGASDYMLKDNLTRLVPAVTRELREAEGRRQRRAAEAALRESQALLSLIYNHTSDALSLYTAGPGGSWRLTSANTACVRHARGLRAAVAEADLLGRPVEAILADVFGCAPPAVTAIRARFDEAARTGRSANFEQELAAAGRLLVEMTLVPVAGPDGTTRHVLLAARDVTARRRAEEERQRLQARLAQGQKMEALGTLAGGIAHDFNNILTAVLGYADLIQRDTEHDERTQGRVAAILAAASRAQDLVRQILTFSRKQAPDRRPVRLAAVVDEALQVVRATAPPAVTIRSELRGGDAAVLGDTGQLHQVVLNLCTNAVQALGDSRGLLTASVEVVGVDDAFAAAHPPLRPGLHGRLTVADTGPGIDPATLDHIFEPFFTTKAPGRGTGLGLAVVHGIIQAHDGAVTVDSRPGVGTTFAVYLPAALAPVEAEVRPPAPPPQGKGELVLLLDDDAGVVRLGEQLLERLGYRVAGFTDPRAALEAFAAAPDTFAAVVTDLTMPDLSGTEVARRMRARRPDLPVILTSGYLSPSRSGRDADYGVREFLGKPFTLQSLADILAAALSPRA